MIKYLLKIFLFFTCSCFFSQKTDSIKIRKIYDYNLTSGNCYKNLRSLCKDVGHRLSGSNSAQKAVEWANLIMNKTDLDTVYLQQITVPHWVRGATESVIWQDEK